MIGPLIGAGTAAVVLLLAVARLPFDARPARVLSSPRRPAPLADPLTVSVLRAMRVRVPPATTRRRVRRQVGAAVVGLLASPPLTVAVGIGMVVRSKRRSTQRSAAQQRAIAEALPDTVDLFLLTTSSGQALPLAHPRVAAVAPEPLGAALRTAAVVAERGRPRSDALLDALAPLGDRSLALGHVLADHLQHGTPLAPMLERLGDELRLDRRRRAEERARKVPVQLLAPLVACVLPAFALLTVVPLLAASLRSLSL